MDTETKMATQWFKQLRNGNWGVVSDCPLDLGEVAEIPTKGGKLRPATPKMLLWSGENEEGEMTYLYAIAESEPGKPQASQEEIQAGVKAMKRIAELQGRLNKAAQAFAGVKEYVAALELRIEQLEARLALKEDLEKALEPKSEPDVPWNTKGLQDGTEVAA